MDTLFRMYAALLDLIFPRSRQEEEIAALTEDALLEKLRPGERDGVVSLFTYRDPLIRRMIWRLKYRGDRHVARLFGQALHSYLVEEIADDAVFHPDRAYLLVPIPLSSRRRRERGFNQMERVAEAAAACGFLELRPGLLKRIKHTPSQTSIKNRALRKRNVVGAFTAAEPISPHTTVILIDDVLTTGSTIREAARALQSAGGRVMCIALAH